MYKQFCASAHEIYDTAAKDKAIRFWEKLGYDCSENPDEFGVDLHVTGKGRKFNVEVEVKQVWHGLDFPYESLHIPARKAKFLAEPTVFMVFNSSLHAVAIINWKHVKSADMKTVANHNIKFGERFFDIPRDNIRVLVLPHLA